MNACLDPGTPSNVNGQLSLPLVEPLAANSRLLHLGRARQRLLRE